jgi:hypothetical protein
MLTELRCDKFKQSPILFENGLNSILGSAQGNNAIGKSTLLLIIDFVFGGNRYIEASEDIVRHVGTQNFEFRFRFEDGDYYFTRSTDDYAHVNRCDSDYQAIQKISLDDYRKLLYTTYEIGLPFVRFEEITQRFFRIYGKGNTDETMPLKSKRRETEADSVDFLMKLFNQYGVVEAVKGALEMAGVRAAELLSRNPVVFDDEKFKNNETEIAALRERLESLMKENEEAQLQLMSFDIQTVQKVEALRNEIRGYERRRRQLISQLRIIENNTPDNKASLTENFDALTEFFPDANIEKLSRIEHFHNRITEIMTNEIQQEIDKLRPVILILDRDIASLQKQISETGIAQQVSERTLSQGVSISRQIDNLEYENEQLLKQQELQKQRLEVERKLNKLLKNQQEQLRNVQDILNRKITEINDIVTAGQEVPPALQIHPDKSYDFKTPDNTSEGTSYKSLVLYDISMLGLTPIPALIHDSNILMHIDNEHFGRILELYQHSNKQVFIAFDKAEKCTPNARHQLENTAIIHLADGEELFGVSWSKRNYEDKQPE